MILACGRQPGSVGVREQMSPKLMEAHARLIDEGLLHSFDLRDASGALVGGGYGIAIGRRFQIENLYRPTSDATRFGLSVLARHLATWGYDLIDAGACGAGVDHLGFHGLDRATFASKIAGLASGGRNGRWNAEPGFYIRRSAQRLDPALLAAQYDAVWKQAETHIRRST